MAHTFSPLFEFIVIGPTIFFHVGLEFPLDSRLSGTLRESKFLILNRSRGNHQLYLDRSRVEQDAVEIPKNTITRADSCTLSFTWKFYNSKKHYIVMNVPTLT